MERAANGTLDTASDKQIWECLMCNSCSERCELDADPAEVIAFLRNIAAERGNVPDHFVQEARLFLATGLSFPCTGMTRKIRKELGLPELAMKEETLKELEAIVARTRMGRIRFE
jgi:heterodisulfide reductase subunit C